MIEKAVEFLKNIEGEVNLYFHDDSITSESKILVSKNNNLELMTIEELYNKLKEKHDEIFREDSKQIIIPKSIKVFSIKNGKIILSAVKALVKHKTKKRIFEIQTKIGSVCVTEDHSLMTLKNNTFLPEKPEKIMCVASPLKYKFGDLNPHINLLNHPDIFNNLVLEGNFDKKFLYTIGKRSDVHISQLMRYGLPAWYLLPNEIEMIKNDVNFIRIRARGPRFSAKVSIDEKLITLFGLWVADGCFSKGKKSESIHISAWDDKECKRIIKVIAKRFCFNIYECDEGITASFTSSLLFRLMKFLDFRGNSRTKRVPEWIFGLKENYMAAFLRGYFSGDGTVSKGDINATSYSKGLLEDIQTLLLFFGIRARIRKDREGQKLSINTSEMKRIFLEKIGFLQKQKNKKVKIKVNKSNYQDYIPIEESLIKQLRKEKIPKIERDSLLKVLKKGKKPTRNRLKKICKFLDGKKSKFISKIINNDIFWEKPKIKDLGIKNTYVYDIETETGNFIANNMVLKNTDGICSAAIFLAYLKEKGIKPKLNCIDINEESFKILKKAKSETAIFLDLPVDEFLERIKGFEAKKILVVDHHKITKDLNKKGIVHINPRFEEPDAYISASQISYEICKVKNLEWLARIGAVGDRALEGAEDEREAADMIDAITCLKKNKELVSLAKLLSRCEKIEDFLYIEKYRELKKLYEKEMQKQISLFEIYGVSDINWFEVKSGFPVTSSLATRLFDLFPKKTIITYTKSRGVYNLSGRSAKYDLGSIFKKASEGLGTGGGHPQSAGAEVKNLHEFKRRVMEMLK